MLILYKQIFKAFSMILNQDGELDSHWVPYGLVAQLS